MIFGSPEKLNFTRLIRINTKFCFSFPLFVSFFLFINMPSPPKPWEVNNGAAVSTPVVSQSVTQPMTETTTTSSIPTVPNRPSTMGTMGTMGSSMGMGGMGTSYGSGKYQVKKYKICIISNQLKYRLWYFVLWNGRRIW